MNYVPQGPLQALYLHWPFCPYRCSFCPFVALAGQDEYMQVYHEALVKEVIGYARNGGNAVPVTTIFIGGGTPSTWPEHLLLDMFAILNSEFDVQSTGEITLEINPGTVTEARVDAWQKAGITRISMGVQAMNDQVLASFNRRHTAQDVYTALALTEFRFIRSVDLILGLPGVDHEDWRHTIDTLSRWDIQHMSVYFLTVHEDTPLYFGVKTQRVVLPPEESVVDEYFQTVAQLQSHGFQQYELSNFARLGNVSRHNQAYWTRQPYRGFGLGACSFDGHRRFQNEKNLVAYLNAMQTTHEAWLSQEELSPDQVWLEELMLSLRTREGISRTRLAGYEQAQRLAFHERVDDLVNRGYLEWNNDALRLTLQAKVIENEIIVQLSS
jgi:oxygen-independent coproporphyrinogen III oxidase